MANWLMGPTKQVHRKFFGTDVAFGQDFNGIVCASHDIDAAVPAADAKIVQHVQHAGSAPQRHDERQRARMHLYDAAFGPVLDRFRCGTPRRRPPHGAPASGARGQDVLFADGFRAR